MTTLDTLTPRQRDVAVLVAEGLSNAEIGARMSIQEQTIKNHLMDLYILTGVKNSPAFNRRVRLARLIWEAMVHELVADLTQQEAA